MASQSFQGQRRYKSNHRQTTIQQFRMLVEAKLRLSRLNVGHLRLNCETVQQTLIVNVKTSSHVGAPGVLKLSL
jgi:hypothetical protein